MFQVSQPQSILIGGVMGSGKTTLGLDVLHHCLGSGISAVHIDIDDVARKHTPILTGDDAYNALLWESQHVFQRGDMCIISATFRDPHTREQQVQLARRFGYGVVGIFLSLSESLAIQRAEERTNHLLPGAEAQAKILDWRQRFSQAQHPDLQRHPWAILDGSNPVHKLTEFTLRHLNIPLIKTTEGMYSRHKER